MSRSDNGAPPPLAPLRTVIKEYGLNAKKSLGQHFILDGNLTDRIAHAAGDLSEGTVVEIGPGPGGLTRSLLAAGARQLIAVERDPRAIAALAPLVERYPGRLEIVGANAATLAMKDLGAPPRRIVANLPFNIATKLLIQWLGEIEKSSGSDDPVIAGMTLMFQKEVANRICAEPGGTDYGRLSILAQWLCVAKTLFDVPARVFVPPPRVTSTVLTLTPHGRPLYPTKITALERVTAAAFGQRRKMLRSSLRSLAPSESGLVNELMTAAGLRGDERPQDLSIEVFCALARAYQRADASPAQSPSRVKSG